MNFRKADWEGFTAETERNFTDAPLPSFSSAGEKVFRRILGDACRHHIPCSYVRDYCCPLPEVVRPLVSERDQRRIDDQLDSAIKLLDRDIQRHIPTGSAKAVTIPAGILRPRYQSQALLVPPAQAGWQEVESPTQYFNRLRRKNPLQPEGDCTSLQETVHCLFRPTRSGHQKALEEPPPPTPSGFLIQTVRRERRRRGH